MLKVELLIRTPGSAFYNIPGAYACTYTLSTTGDTLDAPAILIGGKGGAGSGTIVCPPPLYVLWMRTDVDATKYTRFTHTCWLEIACAVI
jgi:hypothetical protein